MSKRKKLFLLSILFFALFCLARNSQAAVDFSDSFERTNAIDNNWTLSSGSLADRFSTITSPVYSGVRSLRIHNNGAAEEFERVNHWYSEGDLKGVVSVAFYDFGDNRSRGSLFSVGNRDVSQYIILQINANQDKYVYRIKDQQIVLDKIPRSAGWHILEFVVTEYGTYGKIDGRSLSDVAINFDLKEIGFVQLARGWGLEGDTYFDELKVTNLFEMPSSQQTIFDSWSDQVYEIYKNTDFSLFINNGSAGGFRPLSDQAMMHLYYYYRDNNQNDLNKAKNLINSIMDKYDLWKKSWNSVITAHHLALFEMWWMWPEFDQNTRNKIYDIVIQEADYWTWALNEIRNNPNGYTLPEGGLTARRPGQPNWSFITTNPDTDDHLNDTRAEENSALAQFLAAAYNMYPDHPNAASWNEAAKCFAFHTFSRSETACGIRTRTISDDSTLGNHGLYPNPGYALASIGQLQLGGFAYVLKNRSVPSEFLHNIGDRMNSPVWVKNVSSCMDAHYEITEACHKGQDWGDNNLRSTKSILIYWAKVNQDGNAEIMLSQMLRYFYYVHKDTLRRYVSGPQSVMEPYDQEGQSEAWWMNLEAHNRVSIKFLFSSQYQNSNFRNKYFPQNLDSSSPAAPGNLRVQ